MNQRFAPFVLLPGGPGFPATYYYELVVGLTESGEVSVPPATEAFPKTVADAALNVGTFVNSLEDPPILVGHSFGAAVAIEALARGVSAKAVILISGYSSGAVIREAILSRQAGFPKEFHDRYRDSRTPEEVGALLFEYWVPAHFCRVALPHSIATGLAGMDQAFVQHYLGNDFFDPSGEMLNWDRSAYLRDIAVPVLVLAGASDYLSRIQIERMCADIPNCRAWIGEHSSHNCWIEEPEAVFMAIREFLADIDATGE
jgi:pimeloyl-ACP methyl ester carboxylesterase